MGEELFREVTDTLLTSMEVKVRKQRLDSTHVLSDMACLGRVRMMGVALRRFFTKVLQHFASIKPICEWPKYLQHRTIFDQQCELREEFIGSTSAVTGAHRWPVRSQRRRR